MFRIAAFFAVSFVVLAQQAFAVDSRNLAVVRADASASDQRVALVIGNAGYKSSPLKNPVNDAHAVSAKLRSLGFTVIERENLTIKQIGSTLREFRSKLAPGGVALFFYAGHGLQVQGTNYLPAVDADIASEEDVSLQSLEVGKVLQLMDEAKTRLNLVFLDACRNNPYARSFRSTTDGLARVSAPSGTLISFATRPGSVAADGEGRNGLYTEQLLSAMDLRDQPIELVLKRVVSGVKAASKGRQEPWMEGSIEGDFCFVACGAVAAHVPATPTAPVAPDPAAIELSFWDSIKSSTNRSDFEEYLRQYPNGRFAGLARNRLQAQQAASIEPTKPAVPTKPAMPAAVMDLTGTSWSGIDGGERNQYEMTFMPGGVWRYSYNGNTYTNGTWKQDGDRIYIETNKGYAVRTGTVSGNRISGTAENIRGATWEWSYTRKSGAY